MRICCISDTHSLHRQIKIPKNIDLILFAGDISNRGELSSINDFNRWIGDLSIPTIAIPGNHDLSLEKMDGKLLLNNMTYLVNEITNFQGLRIFGSPMVPRLGTWAFGQSPREAMRFWSKVPKADVLLTHSPPRGILDRGGDYMDELGCPFLEENVRNRIRPKLHLFGHIHESSGIYKSIRTTYVNASICDFPSPYPLKAPIIVDL
jgi:Icc-related predicted phosphoesterase